MTLISRMRKQKAVWFARGDTDRFGEPSYAAGVLIDCRWDDAEAEFTDPEGQRKLSSAVVYVDREMNPGDLLLKSSVLPAWNGTDNPRFKDGVYRAARCTVIPNLRNTENLLPVYLI